MPLIPTALFSICVPQIMAAWQATAAGLTSWEVRVVPSLCMCPFADVPCVLLRTITAGEHIHLR